MDVTMSQVFINEKAVYDLILNLTPERAREIGIKHRSALAYLMKKAKEEELNFQTRNMKRIINIVCKKNMKHALVSSHFQDYGVKFADLSE